MAPLVWLITGCSSGFGEQFVHQILARGDKVIATGRQASTRLSHLKETDASILELDVTASPAEIDAKVQEAIAIYGHIDILINNAGFVSMSFVEETTQEDLNAQLATNLFGPINITRALLPHFRSRRAGKIAFTGSIYSWISTPGAGPYAISKHGLTAFASTLQVETAPFGIQVVSFEIGHFRTLAASPQNAKIALPTEEDYRPMKEELAAMARGIDGFQPGDPVAGVRAMVDVLTGEKRMPLRVPVGPDAAEIVKGVCEGMLGTIGEWEGVTCGTDFPGPKQGIWAQGS